MKIEHSDVKGNDRERLQNLIIYLELMRVKKLFVEKMNYVMIIGFIIHVNVNHHFSVNNVIKVRSHFRAFIVSTCFRLVAPIVIFNQSTFIDVSLASSISNISFFFNTLHSNGTLFELISSSKPTRLTRDLISHNRSFGKILGTLVNGEFRLIVIDNEPKPQEYQLRHEQKLNDGHPHQIQLDLNHHRLIIDGISNLSLTKINNKIIPNQFQFNPDQSLNGWLQDLRINNQFISFVNTTEPKKDLNVTILNIKQMETNPCYPTNPCQNQGICLVTNSYKYL
jgi:hypothetical protein